MNVVHVTHHFSPCIGGIETVVFEYAQYMAQKGINTTVVCLNKCPNTSRTLPKKENIHGISVERIPFRDLKYYKIAPAIIKKIKKADIVHIHGIGFFSDFLLLLKPIHQKKVVVSTYGGIFHTKTFSFLKNIYFKVILRVLFRQADAIISIGTNDTRLFSRVVPEKKIKQIEIGVNITNLLRLPLKKKKNTFLFVGRLAKNKNLETLVEVFARAVQQKPAAQLVIAGDDFDGTKEKLEKKIRERGIQKNVRVVGKCTKKNLEKLFAESEFFVSASGYESFGISAVEGMAAGLIPLLSPLPSFKQFVRKNSGIIVDFENKKKAAQKIVSVMEYDAKKKMVLRENARKKARDYSWKKSCQRLMGLYSCIMGQLALSN